MKDLGFGLLDRRVVIVTLFTLVIINTLFQYNLPIRTNNAGEFFVDLTLFTGYLYLARLLYRFPVSLFFGFWGLFTSLKDKDTSRPLSLPFEHTVKLLSKDKKTINKIKIGGIKILQIPAHIIYAISFAGYSVSSSAIDSDSSDGWGEPIIVLLKFIDRACLIVAIFLATLSKYALVTKIMGALGLFVMVAIYLVMGQFSIFYTDKIEKE